MAKSTGIILLDIEKAFDSVWHDGLIHKLVKFGFPIYIVKLVKSFLEDRMFSVSINGTLSAPKNIPAGAPQGSVLSPTLYNIFIADMPIPLNCELALYVDDTALINTLVR